MASDGVPVTIPVTSLVNGGQVPTPATVQEISGNALPPSGKTLTTNAAAAAAAGASAPVSMSNTVAEPPANKPPAAGSADAQSLVTQLNKYLNDTGRPDQYRVDPSSNDKLIQQINPATGAVIGEFLVSEFPALARSVGASGLLVDSHA
jgi:hypothetical protein